MSLFDEGKVIIEVGLNEWASKDSNPNVPYGEAEVVADGIACAEAGAAILHFHARADDGSQAWSDADTYRAEMAGIGQASDVIMYPSYNGGFDGIWELLDEPPPGAPMCMTPFDVFQTVGLVTWDPTTKRFTEAKVGGLEVPSKGDTPPALAEMVRRGQVPSVCAQELGEVRWVRHAIEAGLLPTPVALKVFVIGAYVKGPEPTPAGLDALLTDVTDDMEPMVVPYFMPTRESVEAVLRHALSRRTHIRVGLGDNAAAFPGQTNLDLVRWAVDLVHEAGLEPATPQDVRRYFGASQPQPVS